MNNLKDQFTLRIYSADDKNLLDKTYARVKQGFDNISDFIRHCVVLGATKLLGNNEIDQTKNLNELNENFKTLNEKYLNLEKQNKETFRSLLKEIKLSQKLANNIAYIVYGLDCNKENDSNVNDGEYYLPELRKEILDIE